MRSTKTRTGYSQSVCVVSRMCQHHHISCLLLGHASTTRMESKLLYLVTLQQQESNRDTQGYNCLSKYCPAVTDLVYTLSKIATRDIAPTIYVDKYKRLAPICCNPPRYCLQKSLLQCFSLYLEL